MTKYLVVLAVLLVGCVSSTESKPDTKPSTKAITKRDLYAESMAMQAAEVEVLLKDGKFSDVLQQIEKIEKQYTDWNDLTVEEQFALENLEDSLLEAQFMALLCSENAAADQLQELFDSDPDRFFERFISDGSTTRSRASFRYFQLSGNSSAAEISAEHMGTLLAEDDVERRFRFHITVASMLLHEGHTEEALSILGQAGLLAAKYESSGISALREYSSLTLLPALAMALSNDFKGGTELIRLEMQKSPEHPMGTRLQRYQKALEALIVEWPAEQARISSEASDLPKVEFITDKGRIVITLFEDDAPNTVASFVSLVEAGFYDGLLFHRVVPHFVVQGGDPNGTGEGGSGYSIKLEANRKHFRGSLGMARSADPDSAGSQFYFCLNSATATHLDGKYCVFGRVSEGLSVMDELLLGSTIIKAVVLNKRDHAYKPVKLPEKD